MAYLLLVQQPWVRFLAFPKIFSGKIIDEVNQWHWLEECGQWLENVDLTQAKKRQNKVQPFWVIKAFLAFLHLFNKLGSHCLNNLLT